MTFDLHGQTVVLASHNRGKLAEFEAAFSGTSVRFVSAGDLGLASPDETGATFEANALIKAQAAANGSGQPALADDSGLCVVALGGAPGVYSARWAGEGQDYGAAFQRLEREIAVAGSGDHRAAFVCVLALVFPNEEAVVVQGRVEGTLQFPPLGDHGFGYDPVFVPEGDSRTFAEMTRTEKGAYSHRARAIEELRKRIIGV